MKFTICKLDASFFLTEKTISWIVQSVNSFVSNVSEEDLKEAQLGASTAFAYYARAAYNANKDSSSYNFDKSFIFKGKRESVAGVGNVNTLSSWCRLMGFIYDADGIFRLSDYAQKYIASGKFTTSEVCLVSLSRQWVTIDGVCHRPLLSVLYELTHLEGGTFLKDLKNYTSASKSPNKMENQLSLQRQVFEQVMKRPVSKDDAIQFSRFDALRNTLLLANIIKDGVNGFSLTPNGEIILKLFYQNEQKLYKYNKQGDVNDLNYFNYVNSTVSGVFEIINQENVSMFEDLYPNIAEAALNESCNAAVNDSYPRQIIFYGAPGTGKSYKINKHTNGVYVSVPYGSKENFESALKKFLDVKFDNPKTASSYYSFLIANVHSNLYANIINKPCASISSCYDVNDAVALYNAFKSGGVLDGININSLPSAALKNYIEFLNTIDLDARPKERPVVYRTTFHPDTDYASFVGCYKPVSNDSEKSYNIHELAFELATSFPNAANKIHFITAFYFKYAESLKSISIKELLQEANLAETYVKEFANARDSYCIYERNELQKTEITYTFVPQVFTKAYMYAWSNPEKPVYLVIEEINRGNCAQIFGDLFQLLDRKNGVSEYSIKADDDLRKYLQKECPESINNGELRLPSNLYIWATMNTSDQSLFPIDSAFKRRWDWEYVPIRYNNYSWTIEIGQQSYSWTLFQKKINKLIKDATESEDKMLGDYFVKAENNIISAKTLLNKIIFYLWNDVCKDGEGDIFRINTTEAEKEIDHNNDRNIGFSDFFENTESKLQAWMRYLEIPVIASFDDTEEDDSEKQAQLIADTETKSAKEVKFTMPIYKTLIEDLTGRLVDSNLSFFQNGFDRAFEDMPISYTRISTSFDAQARKPIANVRLWVPAVSGYSKSKECFNYLKEHDGETLVSQIAQKHNLPFEEIGTKSSNPNPTLGWKIKIPMTFNEENAAAEADKVFAIMEEMFAAFAPLIKDFQNNK